MEKHTVILFLLVLAVLTGGICSAGCLSYMTVSDPVIEYEPGPGPTVSQSDPLVGTWVGRTTNPNGYEEKYTLIFNTGGTGRLTAATMGFTQSSDFTWTLIDDHTYRMDFPIAASGFSQKNTLTLSSGKKTCSVIGVEFTKS